MLWLPTTREMKYKAKQAVDTFFVRMGDVSSAVSVWVCVALLSLPVQRFAWLSVALSCAWFAVALAIGRVYADKSASKRESEAPT